MEKLKMAYELKYCRGCIQVTNHIGGVCLKCGTEDTSYGAWVCYIESSPTKGVMSMLATVAGC